MKVTLKDIAQRCGVSVNTVSLALRNMPSVRQETRENILRAVEELGYSPQKSKSEMRNIGLVSTGARLRDSYFYMSFHQRILSTAYDHNYNMMVFKGSTCDVDPKELRRIFEANSIAGIIILGDMDERIASKVAQCGIPVVAIGTRYQNLAVCVVTEDNFQGGLLAVKYLRNRGASKIGFLGSPRHSTGFMERFQGFLGAMTHFSMPVDPEHLVLDLDPADVYNYEQMLKSLRRRSSLPEAFLCDNDNIALIGTKALLAMGLNVPQDVSLIGFDNTVMGKMAIPSITSVDVHCATQAETCVEKLISFITSGRSSKERILLPVTLTEGESVREFF